MIDRQRFARRKIASFARNCGEGALYALYMQCMCFLYFQHVMTPDCRLPGGCLCVGWGSENVPAAVRLREGTREVYLTTEAIDAA